MTSPIRGQPIPRDGEEADAVVLRPSHADDVEAPPLRHDHQSSLVPDGVPRVVSFAVERSGQVAGSVEVRLTDEGAGRLSWALHPDHRGLGTGLRAVRLLVAYAFDRLGVNRVEAYVHPDDTRSLRVATRAGLRREGIVRGGAVFGGERGDAVLLGRLVDDPGPQTPDGFRAMLNAGLPTKRVIAQGAMRDPAGRVLLCELVYKPDWDLPGGVVEPGESPRTGIVREVREELGVDVVAGRLLAVDWLLPWAGWDDACVLVFDLGVRDPGLVDSAVLEPREIAAVHWCDPALARARARPPTAARVEQVLAQQQVAGATFLHSGQVPAADTTPPY